MTSPIIKQVKKIIEKAPHKNALIFQGEILTYRELGEKVNNLSYSLSQRGITRGDHIGVVLPNGVEFCLVMLAAANLGVTIVPHSISLTAQALGHAFNKSEVNHYIIWHSLVTKLQAETHPKTPNNIWVSVGKKLETATYFDDLLNISCKDVLGGFSVDGDSAYIFTMTSGSTGTPKPIILSQSCKIKRAEAAIKLYNITSSDVILAATPLYHSLAERLVLMPLMSGGTVVIMASFSANRWLTLIEKYKISFTIAVSSQLKKINDELKSTNNDLSSLRCLVSSSERLSQPLKNCLLSKLKCEFHECYGASEVAIISNLDHSKKNNSDSVGKPINDVHIRILDNSGNPQTTWNIGEIACKTSMAFSGYFKQKQQTQASHIDGYFLTGDLGKIDDEGFLYFCGRKKEIIITGGINVYPKDVEDVLLKHPDIIEVAAIPLADESLGEIVTVVIVSKRAIYERDLQRLCAKNLADYQQPRKYIFTKQLPKNTLGKVMKPLLIEQFSNSIETAS